MRVVFLLTSFFKQSSGGAEYQAYLLARVLAKQHRVSYIYEDHNTGWSAAECDGIRLCPIPRHSVARRVLGRPFILNCKRLKKLFETIRPDVIYSRGGSAYTGITARYCRKSHSRFVWHIASERDVRASWHRSMRTIPFDCIDKKALEYGIRHADAIVGQAQYQDRLLQENYGRRCDLIVGNWHPVPTEKIVKEDPTTVVWIANMKALKQPEVFIAMAQRLNGLPNIRLVMVGRRASGRLGAVLDGRLRAAGNVECPGELGNDEVNRLLARSHVLVNTSAFEGFPNTFIQAWMRCVPVVSLHVDPDDVLKRERIGFHSGSFDNLVRDTRNLIENGELRHQMGQRARRHAIRHHALDLGVSKMTEMMNSLC